MPVPLAIPLPPLDPLAMPLPLGIPPPLPALGIPPPLATLEGAGVSNLDPDFLLLGGCSTKDVSVVRKVASISGTAGSWPADAPGPIEDARSGF